MKWFFAVNEAALSGIPLLWEPMILAAVESARQKTSLKPHLVFHGSDNHPFLEKLRKLGVVIVHHELSYLDAIEEFYGAGSQLGDIASGAFLRTELPILELEDECVLYTDCDVIFEREPILTLSENAPFACAPEFDREDYSGINTGVMLMNLALLRRSLPDFTAWIRCNLSSCATYDQDAYRLFYSGQACRLPLEMNWKPYWGISSEARIVHFHGPKPSWAERLLGDPLDKTVPIYTELFNMNPEGYRFYVGRWNDWRDAAEMRYDRLDAPSFDGNYPVEFSHEQYRANYADLARLSRGDLRRHFEAHGADEGRTPTKFAYREHFITIVDRSKSVLELGPYVNPVFKGENIAYFDILDAEALRRRAAESGLDAKQCPEEIHYTGCLSSINEVFNSVFGSHNIEHHPDLIRHLNDVERILQPGGSYFLIIPDKRYCFDHFIPESNVAHVIAAHSEGRVKHALTSVIEHIALTTHNDPGRHWRGDHGPANPSDRIARIKHAVTQFESAGESYVDVHAWQFTPEGFRTIIQNLFDLSLIKLAPQRVYNTPQNSFEFCAILTKPSGGS